MSVVQCFCGWQGLQDTMMLNGKPTCPNCRKPFTKMRCEGCSE